MTEKKKEQTEKDFEYEKLISDDELVYNIRMSNFIKFDKNPFRFNENGKKVDFDSNKDENGNFVLRWRNNFKNDKFFKESNSRFVEWSDGSKQLVIGTKAFNVSTESLPKKSYLFLRKEKDKHILLKSISKQLIVQSTKETALKRFVAKEKIAKIEPIAPERATNESVDQLRRKESAKLKMQKRLNDLETLRGKSLAEIELTKQFLEEDFSNSISSVSSIDDSSNSDDFGKNDEAEFD